MDEIKEMIRDSEDGFQDTAVIEDLGMDCFDASTVRRYLAEVTARRPGHPWSLIPTEQFLEASGAAVTVGGEQYPTAAGLLMFGKVSCIRRVMSGYFLDYRERIDGDRWDFRIQSNSGEWSGNIYDFVSEVMPRLSLKIGSSFELEGFANVGGSRTLASVREAVLNGVIHADYNLSTGVEVQWTPKMLKVTNPGTMRVPVREAKKGGRSDPRNGTLVALAMAAGWVERIGSGLFAIDRSVSDGYLESFDIIENTDPSTVTAILEFPLLGARASGNASAAMRIIAARPDITRAELAQEMGVSLSTAANTLSELKASGRIERIGGNRKGYWRIIERSPSLSHRPQAMSLPNADPRLNRVNRRFYISRERDMECGGGRDMTMPKPVWFDYIEWDYSEPTFPKMVGFEEGTPAEVIEQYKKDMKMYEKMQEEDTVTHYFRPRWNVMRIYECYDCNAMYVGDESRYRMCPECGSFGNEADRVRYYECYNCNRIYPGDESRYRMCPECGSFGNEVGRVRFYECYNCNRIYVGDEGRYRACPRCSGFGNEM